MVKEAEANKDADRKKREAVDARNQADTLIHSTEKNLKEHGAKVSEADKKAIETAASNLRNALKGTDVDEIKKKTGKTIDKFGKEIKEQTNTPGKNVHFELQKLCTANIKNEPGKTTYTQMLNEDGGIETDLTVVCFSKGLTYVIPVVL